VKDLQKLISSYKDFPRKGIIFKDLLGILRDPELFKELIIRMSESFIIKECEAIASIDARGFIFGSPLAVITSKPMVVFRKPGKLPGELITEEYELEYGKNSLSIQKDAIKNFSSFAIVDDLLATGGTANCASSILKDLGKDVTGLSVVGEIESLKASEILNIKVDSQIKF
tara:strand:- start:22 stop:534 length:513 start_codon:yes stop_codon:yes gene_type:complete